jgi:hypothetical protein
MAKWEKGETGKKTPTGYPESALVHHSSQFQGKDNGNTGTTLGVLVEFQGSFQGKFSVLKEPRGFPG